jgi:hypothetical protein
MAVGRLSPVCCCADPLSGHCSSAFHQSAVLQTHCQDTAALPFVSLADWFVLYEMSVLQSFYVFCASEKYLFH